MKPHQQCLRPVIQRMAGDMKVRNKAQATIDAYTCHVQRFARFLGEPLQRATPDDVRNLQLHLLEELLATEWVSYIEPPPTEGSDPGTVIKHLGRSLTGGPISDARILA